MIAATGNGDTVGFDPSLDGQTIVLTSGAIEIDKSLTIDGPGAASLTIDADHASRIFTITAGDLSISGLTLANGAALEEGGAIFNQGLGSLAVSGCAFGGNTAGGPGGSGLGGNAGRGGAISVSEGSGATSVTACSFTANSAGGSGGTGYKSGLGNGGAIWDGGESLAISASTFAANRTGGNGGGGYQSGAGVGGAIQKAGGRFLTVSDSEFTGNTAGGVGGSDESSGRGFGGAVASSQPEDETPALTIVDSSFSDNAAGGAGGEGPVSGVGSGGAVLSLGEGTLTVSGSTFTSNRAGGVGGAGGGGSFFERPSGSGGGFGGAIFASEFSTSVSVSDSVFSANTAGGDGGSGALSGRGEGGAINTESRNGPVSIADTEFAGNVVGGEHSGGAGSGFGAGGAIDSASPLAVSGSTFSANLVAGPGASGFGGAINQRNNVSPLIVSGSTFSANVAGADGGIGNGGAIYTSSGLARSAPISNTTLVGNVAGGATGKGGAISIGGEVAATLTSVTIDRNEVGAGGDGAGIYGAATVTAKATIVSGGKGATNCDGPVASSSFSLEGPSGDASCGLALPSADPLLEPLADNGGPTETQALPAASPAVDAVPAAKCPTEVDQRGEPRPDNGKDVCDVGAFELQDPPVAPTISSAAAATFEVGEPGEFIVTATGLPTPILFATGTLPSGVTFSDNGDGTASLAGKPGAGTGGGYPITIKAANGAAPDHEQSFLLTVQAPPPVATAVLAVELAGDGTGAVSATAGAIACPPACSHAYELGTQVELTATTAPDSTFAGWAGACTGTGPCELRVGADAAVSARFVKVTTVPAGLRIIRVRPRLAGAKVRVVVGGTIAKTASGSLRVTVGSTIGGRTLRATRKATIRDGRWSVRLKLPAPGAGRSLKIKASARFHGSPGVEGGQARRSAPFAY